MRHGIGCVAMDMKMLDAVMMEMPVEVNPVSPQPPQKMQPKSDQHDADRCLQRLGETFRYRVTDQQRGSRKYKQRDGVTEPPGQPVLDNIGHTGSPRGDGGDGRDVIGLFPEPGGTR